MELLVILVLDLIPGLFAIVAAIAGGIVSVVGEILAAVLGASFERRRKGRPADVPKPAPRKRSSPVWRHILLVPAVVIGLGLVVVNAFFLEDVARWGLGRIGEKSGTEMGFERLEGNIFTGRFEVEGLTAARPVGDGIGFDVALTRFDIDVAMPSVLAGTVRVETMGVHGLAGTVTRPPEPIDVGPSPAPEAGRKMGGGRDFEIERLEIADVHLMLTGEGAEVPPVEVVVASALSEPLRSNWAVFDFFFRSNIDATVNGAEFRISSAEITDGGLGGRHTEWAIGAVPLAMFADYLPRAPFTWMEGGQFSATVTDEWRYDDADRYVDMDWQVTLAGTSVRVPAEAGFAEKLAAEALAKVVNGREDDVVLGFRTRIDRDRFENTASLDAAGVWEEMARGVAEAFRPGGVPETDSDGDEGDMLDGARDLWNRRFGTDDAEN